MGRTEQINSKRGEQRHHDTRQKKEKQNIGSEEKDIPEITEEEIRVELKIAKNNRAVGPDGILSKMLEEGGFSLQTELGQLFNKCIEQGRIPKSWLEADVILIHKIGHMNNLGNSFLKYTSYYLE